MASNMRLVIIGAGPKAMAIAAKSCVLQELGFNVPRIEIIERSCIGAHWTGDFGYTNGRLRLGTLPEKDVGFPYHSTCWGEELGRLIDERMLHYGWQSFLVARGDFSDWVDRGRPQPEHRQWAEYLQWVSGLVARNVSLTHGTVHSLSLKEDRWLLVYLDQSRKECLLEGDGLVMTGPGLFRGDCAIPMHDNILTTESFWRSCRLFRDCGSARVAIVGAGESAASILLALNELGNHQLKIDIISPSGMLYSRGESFQENRIYSGSSLEKWQSLSETDRWNFIHRTDQGVFSVSAHRLLGQADNIEVLPGRLQAVNALSAGELELERVYGERSEKSVCDYLILAMCGDNLASLRELLSRDAEREILQQSKLPALEARYVRTSIDWNLALSGLQPRLHLPGLAGLRQGPGFSNLSCLGLLSDRILETYVDAVAQVSGRRPVQGEHHASPDR